MTINYPRKRQRRNRERAFWKTLKGLREKLPIFVVATVSVFGLSLLDRSKVSYQTAKNNPLEVNDKFVKAVKPGVWTDWLNNPYHFKYHKFANPTILLETLASRAIADNAAVQTRLDVAQRQVVEKAEREKAELEGRIAKSLEKQTAIAKQKQELLDKGPDKSPKVRAAQIKKLQQDWEDVNQSIEKDTSQQKRAAEDYKVNKEQYAAKTRELADEARVKIDSIYNELGPALPSIILQIQDKPRGLFENLLRPILDDQSSLFVIYQILRITAMILLVLSFVFVLAMALRQLPLANGSDTITEQLRGLIKGGGGQEIARAAVLGVAAVSVGTAAVVAGNQINDKADRAIEMASAAASPGSNNPFLRDAYYRNTLYGGNRTYTNTTNLGGEGETTPVFSPINNIAVPEPLVRIVAVSDRAGTQAIIRQLNAIGSSLPLTDITTLKDKVVKAQEDIASIKSGLGDFKTGATTANLTLASIGSSLTQLSADKNKQAAAHHQQMVDTNNKLETINTNIDGLRRENLLMLPRSAGRNFATRAGQFFGSESFALSEQTYESIVSQLPKTPDYASILSGLAKMKYQLPMDKGTFLTRLRDNTASGAISNKEAALKLLKAWEAMILSYARLPR